MKTTKYILIISLIVCNLYVKAQTSTGKIDSLTYSDATNYSYIGEIKDNLPNGLGVAIFSKNSVYLKYVGNFVNGYFEGKGVMLYKNYTFTSSTWQKGELSGKGAYYTKTKDLVVSEFEKNKRNGKTTIVFNDGMIAEGNMNNDFISGKYIVIYKEGGSISDQMYENNKKNGQGYQYELDTKTLFQGIWKENDWLNPTTDNYESFLKNPSFSAKSTEDYNLMSITNAKGNPNGKGFFMSKKKKLRLYGIFKEGRLTEGVMAKDDTLKSVGKYNSKGMNGFCYFIEKKEVYNTDTYFEGEFVDDNLVGNQNIVLNLGISELSFGSFNKDYQLEGKGWQCEKYNALKIGEFSSNDLYGNGRLIDETGFCINGTWSGEDLVKLISLTNDKGELVDLNVSTLKDALSLVYNHYYDYGNFWGIVHGLYQEDDKFDWAGDSYRALVKFPQSEGINYLAKGEFFTAVYKTTPNFKEADLKYKELCKQLNGFSIKTRLGNVTLTGKTAATLADYEYSLSPFTFADDTKEFNISVLLYKDRETLKYKVAIICGPKFPTEVLVEE
jgi:hypothetical protein